MPTRTTAQPSCSTEAPDARITVHSELDTSWAMANNVPINRLHGRGFTSIGCAPCTRAIIPGEPERAGRWWWEDGSKRECGLHVAADAAR